MDNTLIVMLISLGLVAIFIAGGILLKKYGINLSTLLHGVDIAKSTSVFIKLVAKDMGLDENLLDNISDIIMDALEYIKSIPDEVSKEAKITAGTKYAEELCYTLEIPMSEDREIIIETLITVGLNMYESLKK